MENEKGKLLTVSSQIYVDNLLISVIHHKYSDGERWLEVRAKEGEKTRAHHEAIWRGDGE